MRTPERRTGWVATIRRAALCTLLLSAGCAEAPPPGAQSASFAAAPHGGPWQQFCEQAWSVPQASALVGARGADGWELVAMYNGVLCYKRPSLDRAPRPRAGAPAPGGTSATTSPYVPSFRDPGF